MKKLLLHIVHIQRAMMRLALGNKYLKAHNILYHNSNFSWFGRSQLIKYQTVNLAHCAKIKVDGKACLKTKRI